MKEYFKKKWSGIIFRLLMLILPIIIGGYFIVYKYNYLDYFIDIELNDYRLNNVLIYEIEDKLRIGLEAYYFSPQKLNDGRTGRKYWIFGLMTEKMWEDFSVFLNFENFLDTRQTKFETIYTGSISNPTFNDIYAPVDGFVVNGGLKIRL